MTQSKKIWMAILAFAPIIFLFLYIFFFFSFGQEFEHFVNYDYPETFPFMSGSFTYMIISIILFAIFGLMALIFYLIDIVNSKKLQEDGNMKVLWVLLVILLGTIGRLVYFFVEIMPRKIGEPYKAEPLTDYTN